MRVHAPNGAEVCIPFEDPSRTEIIKESVHRVIRFVKGEITEEELDEETLAPEVLAVSGPLN